MLFGFYNMYNFLYKQGRWKIYAHMGIYIAAIPCLGLNIAFSALTPIKEYCNLSWFLTSYLSVYFNLAVGICQAYLLQLLKHQLTCLFDFQAASYRLNNSWSQTIADFTLPSSKASSKRTSSDIGHQSKGT